MLLLPSPNQFNRINACIYQSYIDIDIRIRIFNIFQHLEELPDQIGVAIQDLLSSYISSHASFHQQMAKALSKSFLSGWATTIEEQEKQ